MIVSRHDPHDLCRHTLPPTAGDHFPDMEQVCRKESRKRKPGLPSSCLLFTHVPRSDQPGKATSLQTRDSQSSIHRQAWDIIRFWKNSRHRALPASRQSISPGRAFLHAPIRLPAGQSLLCCRLYTHRTRRRSALIQIQ